MSLVAFVNPYVENEKIRELLCKTDNFLCRRVYPKTKLRIW